VRVLLLGKNGQVGWELERSLAPLGEVAAFDHRGLDLTDPGMIIARVREVKPAVIVNAAAYTAVDKAEADNDRAMAINGTAPGILAEEAGRLGAMLVHYSTDYVFDGTKAAPYREEDKPNPINAYGRSKLAGEHAIRATGCRHLILRTSWVYGMRGSNFLVTMLRLARARPELRVVADQFGAPTWARHLADATAILLGKIETRQAGATGIFHLAAAGETSWHGFAAAILRATGSSASVVPIPTTEYPTPARRPANSRLDGGRLLETWGIGLPDWEQGLAQCVAAGVL
jgi:dTDP-4-dehydrorhamnose reductase